MPTMNEKPARHLSSVAVKIFLTAVFVFLAAVIVAPFMAELQFNTAQKLAQKYLWQNARQKFESAMCIDPLDATRPAGFADFLKTISSPHPDGDYLLMNSVNLYKRALELDPFNAEYALRLGEVELALFTRSEAKNNFVLIRALDYFKLALKNDPNGFNTSYEVGYRGVEVWPYLNTGFKKLIVERLRYVLGQEYWYSRYIYPQVWQHTNDFKVLERITPPNERTHRELLDFLVVNNLYQFRKKEIEAVDFYMKKEEPEKFLRQEREKEEMFNSIKKEALKRPSMQSIISSSDWHGKTPDGKNDFIKGEMCWSGSMSAALLVPEGTAILSIQAKGSPADGIYPYMIVELDGEVIGETFVNNMDWKEYEFRINTSGTVPDGTLKVLSVTFWNDAVNAQKNEDRNLYIGEARIIKNE